MIWISYIALALKGVEREVQTLGDKSELVITADSDVCPSSTDALKNSMGSVGESCMVGALHSTENKHAYGVGTKKLAGGNTEILLGKGKPWKGRKVKEITKGKKQSNMVGSIEVHRNEEKEKEIAMRK